MRKRVSLPLITTGVLFASLFVATSPAQAHGYVSSPPSRQANCATGAVTGCGSVVFEPQSVEMPKGGTSCNGGGPRFAELNDNSKAWPAASVGQTVTFSWVLTARHATTTWQYFAGGRKLAEFDDGGRQPEATVTHKVSMGGLSGRQTILAIWNIADTPMAFYNCVDLNIGGGGGNSIPPPPTAPPAPPPAPPAAPAPPPSVSDAGGTWSAGTAFATGSTVTYRGEPYRCVQGHTALPGWEPSFVPALWQRI